MAAAETLTQATETQPITPETPQATPEAVPTFQQQMTLLERVIANMEAGGDRNEALKTLLERERFNQKQRLAKLFSVSGQFKDILRKTEEQAMACAFLKIEFGEQLGLNAAEAMAGVDLIYGTPSLRGKLIAARMKMCGYSWEFEQRDAKGVALLLFYQKQPILDRNGKQARVSFTIADAEKIEMWAEGKKVTLASKDTYRNWPEEMCFWRSIAKAYKFYATEVFSLPVPMTEELIGLHEVTEETERRQLAGELAKGVSGLKAAIAPESKTASTPAPAPSTEQAGPGSQAQPEQPAGDGKLFDSKAEADAFDGGKGKGRK